MQISLKELRAREELGLVRALPHPTLPLTLWNYTEHQIYEVRAWDEYTMAARGLVTTGDGPMLDIVAKPFTKFFNVGESPDTMPDRLPDLPYECTEKVDGSLILVYEFQGQIMIHTKGAWDNEQSQHAREYIAQHLDQVAIRDLCTRANFTLCFEITYPGNAAVSYGPDLDMHFIGAISRATGKDLFHADLEGLAALAGSHVVRRFKDMGLKDVFDYNTPGIEGFVVRFVNGLRVKVKTEWFHGVYRVRYYWSEGRMLKMLIMGEPLDASVVDLPADEKLAVAEMLEQLHVRYNAVEADAQRVVRDLNGLSRKDQALILKDKYAELSSICFAMLSGKGYAKIIWKKLDDQGTAP